MNLRFKQVELEDVLQPLQPSLYLDQRDLYHHVTDVDRSVLPEKTRFLIDADAVLMTRSWGGFNHCRDFTPPAGSILTRLRSCS